MKPYYQDDSGITIYCGDCREVLPTIDPAAVDLVLTDPPYGIGVCNRSDHGVGSVSSGSKRYGRMTWDLERPTDQTLLDCISKGKTAIIWGGNYYSLPPSSCWLVWDKMQRGFSFADAELAWTNLKRSVRIYSYSRGQLVGEGKVHPTQKPLPLMMWCLSLCGNISSVLDPFAGSGTTLRAAKDAGLRAIGIEIEERYAEIAARRLEQGVLDFGYEDPSREESRQSSLLEEVEE